MSDSFKIISPVDGSVYAQRNYAMDADISKALDISVKAQARWQELPISERKEICLAAVGALLSKQRELGEELTWQMGRPIQYTPGEIDGFAERARYMIGIAGEQLATIHTGNENGVTRYIQRKPLGVVFSIVPWNYPYLTAVNTIIPALMAGNTVVMKPSSQTAICAERIAEAFESAKLPKGVFQQLVLTHEATLKLISAEKINYVVFTGSVAGGRAVEMSAAGRFIDIGLELGGKDPAYVRADADINFTVENIADGGFFNSGQSCCAIERVYVHDDVYEQFIEGLVETVSQYRVGNPLNPEITLGPMVNIRSAERVKKQIHQAIEKGAKACVNTNNHEMSSLNNYDAYVAPQVLIDVDHTMDIMKEETFGPVVGVMKVSSDAQAIELMNDSHFGLTASVWTQDQQAAITIGEQVQTGTWFMNRCDYLDPALAWFGVKNSGKGCSLSELAYDKLTRPKSFYLRDIPK